MKITLNWLREYVDFNDDAEGLAGHLTMCGLEVESIERVQDDIVLDINVTPNRPDCLSVYGIAREVGTIYGTPLSFPEHDFMAETGELDFNVDILDPDLCHRYAGRIIRNVKVAPSPEWMQRRLLNCGIRAINNVVDITNYVLLELGHPLHAFDLSKLHGKKIIVATSGRVSNENSPLKINLLDGTEREVSAEMLLINDAQRPVALAGIMGGSNSEVTIDTKDLFLESAWFAPASIRRTSSSLGIKTESSFRFERGADIKLLKKSLDRAAFLIHKIAGGSIGGKIDIYPKRHHPPQINLSFEKINRYIGMPIPKRDVLKIVSALGFQVEALTEEISVKPPSSRRDVLRDVDIIEEIVRIYGYNRVPSVVPEAPIKINSQDSQAKQRRLQLIDTCRQVLLCQGYNEAVNYSFIGPYDLDMLNISKEDKRRETVQIINPLSQEDSLMRTLILPSLIKNLVHNLSYGNREIRIFEIAKVFIKGNTQLPDEHNHLALLMMLDKEKSLYRDSTEDFFVLKGVVESLFDHAGVKNVDFVRSTEPFLHPGKSADIVINGCNKQINDINSLKEGLCKIGFIGVLSPQVVSKLSVKLQRQEVLAAEISLEGLFFASAEDTPSFVPLPQFPYIERDTAVVVDEGLEVGKFLEMLQSITKTEPMVEDFRIFDLYRGKGVAEGKKSIAFNVRYRSSDKTLSDSEIETIHEQLVRELLSNTGGSLRT